MMLQQMLDNNFNFKIYLKYFENQYKKTIMYMDLYIHFADTIIAEQKPQIKNA